MRVRSVPAGGLVAVVVAVTGIAWWSRSLLPPVATVSGLDLFHFFLPVHAAIGAALREGRFPLWNEHLALGTSWVAEIQAGTFYPPNLLYAVVSPARAMDWLAAFHLAVGTLGVSLLARGAGLGWGGIACATVAIATGQALWQLSCWPSMLASFSWCPVALWLAWRLGRHARERLTPLALVFAFQIVAGYLQFHLYTVPCAALFAGCAARSWRVAARAAFRLGLAEALALGLAAIAVAPALAAVRDSNRSAETIHYEAVPLHLDDYRTSTAAPAAEAIAPVFAGAIVPTLALLGLIAPARRQGVWCAAAVTTGVAGVLSLGSATPIMPLLWKLPIGNWFTGPYKFVDFVAFAEALLAGIGAHALAERPPTSARVLWLILGSLTLGTIPFPLWSRALGGAVLVLGVLPWRARGSGIVLAIVAAFEILTAYSQRARRPSDAPEFFAQHTEAYTFLSAHAGQGRIWPHFGLLALPRRMGDLVDLPHLSTYDTFETRAFQEYTTRLDAIASAASTDQTAPIVLRNLLDAGWGHYVLVGHDRAPWLAGGGFERARATSDADVWRIPAALPRAFLARRVAAAPAAEVLDRVAEGGASNGGVVLTTEDGPVAGSGTEDGIATIVASSATTVMLTVSAPAPSILVLLDGWSPDWQATIDDRPTPIRHANAIARAIEVPAGAHNVKFRFAPRVFRIAALVSGAAFVALVAAIAIGH